MSSKKTFEPFSEEQQKEYEREARLQYGAEHVNESVQRWKSYSKEEQQAIMDEAGAIYLSIVDAMVAGHDPRDQVVQDALVRWHENLRHFYEPNLDILRGLGELYNTDPAFMATFHKFHADLPPYLQQAIHYYVDQLETAAIERLMAADDADQVAGK